MMKKILIVALGVLFSVQNAWAYKVSELVREYGGMSEEERMQVMFDMRKEGKNEEAAKLFIFDMMKSNEENSEYGVQSLLSAAQFGTPERVQELLEAGADINQRDKEVHTPLMIAAKKRTDLGVIEALAKAEIAKNGRISDEVLPMTILERRGDFVDDYQGLNEEGAVFVKLVEMGADVNAVTKAGFTPLMLAVYMDSLNKVRILIDNGADVNAKMVVKSFEAEGDDGRILYLLRHHDTKYISPLSLAIVSKEKNSADIAEMLVQNGARVERDDFMSLCDYRDEIEPSKDLYDITFPMYANEYEDASAKDRELRKIKILVESGVFYLDSNGQAYLKGNWNPEWRGDEAICGD